MKRIAYGPLNLKPHEFWNLTLKEFQEMIDAWKFKDELEWRKIAQHASWITAPHMKRPVTPDKLLQKPTEKKKTSEEESKKAIEELEAQMGINEGGD